MAGAPRSSAYPPAGQIQPRVVLICHDTDRIDSEGLATWLAASLDLVGIVALREGRGRKMRSARREIRRVGVLRFLDMLAFRIYYRLVLARADRTWMAHTVARLRERYPADLARVPRLVVSSPNTDAVRRFVADLRPDLMIARCKFILEPDIFTLPGHGTFVLHPGICPEYRNAHGCFWALSRRDLDRVGMTLLRVDEGVDTGPAFLQATYAFDEFRESHVLIQYRVVLENLDAIAKTLLSVWRGECAPIPTAARTSATWGQPWLSAYLRWKRAARRGRR